MPRIQFVLATAVVLLATAEDIPRWLDFHNKLVAKIPGANHIVIQNADHMSILNEGAVVEQIAQMAGGVRASDS